MGKVSKKSKRPSAYETDSEDDRNDLQIEREFEVDNDEEEEEIGDEGEEGEEEESEDEDDNDEEDGGEDEEEEDVKGFEAQMDEEMEELEENYKTLRHQEQDILQNLKHHKDEDLLRGLSVKNQKALWDKSLEFRFLIQRVFSNSNKLPQEPLRSSFCDSDEAVNKAYSDLITSSRQTLDCLLELQEALLEKNPSIIQVSDVNAKGSKGVEASNGVADDEEWSRIQQLHCRLAPFRNNSIDKWQRKTQVTTGAAGFKGKLHAFNQNISEQVAAYMRDPSRMLKRMQGRRSEVGVFGADANVDGDPELVDDSEFYQLLLKEFIESYEPTSFESSFYALKRLQTKKRKIVDRRASKSRKIRYHVHEKIANFMAPARMNLPPMAPKLFENLFGLKHKQPMSVS